jgi:hypothetical protein
MARVGAQAAAQETSRLRAMPPPSCFSARVDLNPVRCGRLHNLSRKTPTSFLGLGCGHSYLWLSTSFESAFA